jgi:hypothetical protein
MPALRPEQAADLVAKAIVSRQPRIAPWWVAPTELFSTAAPGTVGVVSRFGYRNTRDSPSARGKHVSPPQ